MNKYLILNICFIYLILSCNLSSEKKLTYKSQNNLEEGSNKDNRLKNIKEGIKSNFFIKNFIYIKSGNPRELRDENNNIISELSGNIRYSYVFAPIKMVNSDGSLSTPNNLLKGDISSSSIIEFKTTKSGDSKYEVKKLELESEKDIDFEKHRYEVLYEAIPLKEGSEDEGYVNVYNFGTTNFELIDAFSLKFNKTTKTWERMFAKLTLYNKETKQDKTYTISLDSELFNDTIKLIKAKYSDALINIPVLDAP